MAIKIKNNNKGIMKYLKKYDRKKIEKSFQMTASKIFNTNFTEIKFRGIKFIVDPDIPEGTIRVGNIKIINILTEGLKNESK